MTRKQNGNTLPVALRPGVSLAHLPPSHPVILDLPGPESAWRAVEGPVGRGTMLIALMLSTLWLWAYFAPLDGGAIAQGVVSPDGNKKTVQHLEGGIIARLDVRDGDSVQKGQPLVVLDSVQPRAMFEALQQESRTLVATRARLEAEKAGGGAKPAFPPEVLAATDPDTRRIVADQQHLFRTRLEMHEARGSVLGQRIAQLEEQIRGFEAQVASADKQVALIAEEVKAKKHLLMLTLIPKPEVLKLERAEAEISGRRGEYVANIARARQQIGETQLQLLSVEAERSDQVAVQLDEVRRRQAEIEQRLETSRDILQRTVVTAPTEGIVLNMKFKTTGGVVLKGEPILDIVPANDVLLIDARISPNDIDIVRIGLPAFVHLSAYSSRITPKVNGTVKMVSADRLTDEVTKQPYFLARVEVARAEIERLTPKVELIPGMPAEVMIVTDRRTLLGYLMKPFLDAWRRSFREAHERQPPPGRQLPRFADARPEPSAPIRGSLSGGDGHARRT